LKSAVTGPVDETVSENIDLNVLPEASWDFYLLVTLVGENSLAASDELPTGGR